MQGLTKPQSKRSKNGLHSLIILIGIATFLTLVEQKSLMPPWLGFF